MAQQGLPAIGEEVPQSVNQPTTTTPPANQSMTPPAAKLPAIGEEVPSSFNAPHAPAQAAAAPPATWGQAAADYAKGFVKMGAKGVQFMADDVPHFFGGAGLSDYADLALGRQPGTSYQKVTEGTKLENTRQKVGGVANIVASLAFPAETAIGLLPSKARAGATFRDIMQVAANQPGDLGPTALSALQAENNIAHGASGYPTVVKKFLDEYVHNPQAPTTTYQEIRKWATNFNSISKDEIDGMSGVVAAHVSEMKALVNRAAADAAGQVGRAGDYYQAMNEYAKAMRNRAMLIALAKKTAIGAAIGGPIAAAEGYGGWLYQKAKDLLP